MRFVKGDIVKINEKDCPYWIEGYGYYNKTSFGKIVTIFNHGEYRVELIIYPFIGAIAQVVKGRLSHLSENEKIELL